MLFDTHLHLIYTERLRYPWLDNIEFLNKPSKYDEYKIRASRLGIKGCLHMEVDVAENQICEETGLISELMEKENGPLKGAISACRPESKKFPEFLEWAQENKVIKGFRRVLHVVSDEISKSEIFRSNVKRLSGTGLTFDVCVSSQQLTLAAELIDCCPDVTFILDHCGVPDIKGGDTKEWEKQITELSKRENLIGKISGIIAYGDADTWGIGDIRPYFEHTVKAFGSKRLIWGSDSPVCNLGGGIETWVAATYAMTSDWTKVEKESLFWKNAVELWGFEKNPFL